MDLPETTEDLGNGSSVDQSDARGVKSSGEGSGQSADDFRATIADYPHDPRQLAHEIYWSRGALSKDVRNRASVMLRDLAIIVEVAGSDDGLLAFRDKAGDASPLNTSSPAAVNDRTRAAPNPVESREDHNVG